MTLNPHFKALLKNPFFKGISIFGLMAFLFALFIVLRPPSHSPEEASRAAFSVPELNDTPGEAKTPAYETALKEASQDRIDQAQKEGKSALPTPIIKVQEEIERQEMPAVLPDITPRYVSQRTPLTSSSFNAEDVQALSEKMQRAIEKFHEDSKPVGAKIIEVESRVAVESNSHLVKSREDSSFLKSQAREVTSVIEGLSAGKVLYAHLKMEANSDIPSPVIAEVLSHPLMKATMMGHFSVVRDHLIITFTTLDFKGQRYTIEAVAVNPETQSFGIATDVDHHYMEKIILPMAAAFIGGYGEISRTPSTKARITGFNEIVETKPFSPQDKLYAAAGKGAETVGRLLEERGRDLPDTVRVAAKTDIGILVLKAPTLEEKK